MVSTLYTYNTTLFKDAPWIILFLQQFCTVTNILLRNSILRMYFLFFPLSIHIRNFRFQIHYIRIVW
jgi:hypothetical protein